MRRSVWLIVAALWLAPLLAAQAGPVVAEVGYVGHGQYAFKKKLYDHAGLVQAILAKHQGEHIDLVSVHLPAGITLADRKDVCQLRMDLGTQLNMHLDVGNGQTQEQFCN